MRHNIKSVEEIPAVAEYNEAKEMLQAFCEANENTFKYYDTLVENLNQKLEAADKIVKSEGVSCGDWELYQYATKYNAIALYEALGREQFLKVGGKLEKITNYAVDKVKIQSAIASKAISKEIADQVVSKNPMYHSPSRIGRRI
jgi:hypothetical protein